MEYKVLNQQRDLYPGTDDTVTGYYTRDNTQIKLTGEYPSNFIKFNIIPLDDIMVGSLKTDPSISFRFIVQFHDGDYIEEWTSQSFLDDLQDAVQKNNPYFTKDKVTIAKIDFGKLKTYWSSKKFNIAEQYAEVDITETIDSKEEIIRHINWLVSSDDKLRNVVDFGGWSLRTTDWKHLGNDYKDALDNLTKYPGDNNYDMDDDDSDIGTDIDTSDDTLDNTTTQPTRRANVDFSPFNTAGNYDGETRESRSGRYYTWLNGKWNIR